MTAEYSTESFQCVRRCAGHRAVCGDLPAAGQEVDAALEGETTRLYIATVKLASRHLRRRINALESFI